MVNSIRCFVYLIHWLVVYFCGKTIVLSNTSFWGKINKKNKILAIQEF